MCYKMKKFLSALMAMAISLSMITMPAVAEDNITVTLDGEKIEFDVPPQIINERTMVPVRAIFEAIGASVDWDQPTQTVISQMGDTHITLTINEPVMYVNGEPKELDTPAMIIDERTLVPARAISEAYGLKVDWIQETQTVVLTTDEYVEPDLQVIEIPSKREQALKVYDVLLKNDIIRKGFYDLENGYYYIELSDDSSYCMISYDLKYDIIQISRISEEVGFETYETICIDRKNEKIWAGVIDESKENKPRVVFDFDNGLWGADLENTTALPALKNNAYKLIMSDLKLFDDYLTAYTDARLSDFTGVNVVTTKNQIITDAPVYNMTPAPEYALMTYDILLKNDIIRKGIYDSSAETYYMPIIDEDMMYRIVYNVEEDCIDFISNRKVDGEDVSQKLCIDRDDKKILSRLVNEELYGNPEMTIEFIDGRWQIRENTFTSDMTTFAYDWLMSEFEIFDLCMRSFTDVTFSKLGITY